MAKGSQGEEGRKKSRRRREEESVLRKTQEQKNCKLGPLFTAIFIRKVSEEPSIIFQDSWLRAGLDQVRAVRQSPVRRFLGPPLCSHPAFPMRALPLPLGASHPSYLLSRPKGNGCWYPWLESSTWSVAVRMGFAWRMFNQVYFVIECIQR